MNTKRTFITSFLLFCFLMVKPQVEQARLIGAYTYNFAQYTTWPNEAKLTRFSIVLISNNEKVIDEFHSFSSSRKIKGKPILLQVYSELPVQIPENVQIVLITQDQSNSFDELYRMTEDLPALLVTQNLSDKRKVMINLYSSTANELLFEVNKANIINHQLSIDPEILLLGGTEIDVAQLFRTSQREMEQLQKRYNSLSDSLMDLNETISLSLQQIEKQEYEIELQQNLLEKQEADLLNGKMEIELQNSSIVQQQNELEKQKDEMIQQTSILQEQKRELQEQKNHIKQQHNNIQQSKITLDSLLGEIENKNLVLDEQSNIIDRQKTTTILALISGFMALLVLFSIVNSYRRKIKQNNLLTKQKVEIVEINKKLKSTNQSLFQALGQLKEAQSQLVSAEKMASLGVLTAGIAHEINNPVNFIYTGINSLKNDYSDIDPLLDAIKGLKNETDSEAFKNKILLLRDKIDYNDILEIIPQTIDDIRIGAERSADIIRGLRNFSRIDSDSRQQSDVHEGIDSAILLLRNKFKTHITIEKHYGQLPKIECYPGKLNQAFLNIIGNAIDAIIDKEGKITISTQCADDQILISIEDTGKGISPENLNKIFDPFFTTKSVGKGVGLGLSITFGIIKDHNGSIEVKSTENKGTIFTISLPCKLNNEVK